MHLSLPTVTEQGFSVSPMQVSHLLHELDYQLSANRKSLEGTISERNGIVCNGGWRREQGQLPKMPNLRRNLKGRG